MRTAASRLAIAGLACQDLLHKRVAMMLLAGVQTSILYPNTRLDAALTELCTCLRRGKHAPAALARLDAELGESTQVLAQLLLMARWQLSHGWLYLCLVRAGVTMGAVAAFTLTFQPAIVEFIYTHITDVIDSPSPLLAPRYALWFVAAVACFYFLHRLLNFVHALWLDQQFATALSVAADVALDCKADDAPAWDSGWLPAPPPGRGVLLRHRLNLPAPARVVVMGASDEAGTVVCYNVGGGPRPGYGWYVTTAGANALHIVSGLYGGPLCYPVTAPFSHSNVGHGGSGSGPGSDSHSNETGPGIGWRADPSHTYTLQNAATASGANASAGNSSAGRAGGLTKKQRKAARKAPQLPPGVRARAAATAEALAQVTHYSPPRWPRQTATDKLAATSDAAKRKPGATDVAAEEQRLVPSPRSPGPAVGAAPDEVSKPSALTYTRASGRHRAHGLLIGAGFGAVARETAAAEVEAEAAAEAAEAEAAAAAVAAAVAAADGRRGRGARKGQAHGGGYMLSAYPPSYLDPSANASHHASASASDSDESVSRSRRDSVGNNASGGAGASRKVKRQAPGAEIELLSVNVKRIVTSSNKSNNSHANANACAAAGAGDSFSIAGVDIDIVDQQRDEEEEDGVAPKASRKKNANGSGSGDGKTNGKQSLRAAGEGNSDDDDLNNKNTTSRIKGRSNASKHGHNHIGAGSASGSDDGNCGGSDSEQPSVTEYYDPYSVSTRAPFTGNGKNVHYTADCKDGDGDGDEGGFFKTPSGGFKLKYNPKTPNNVNKGGKGGNGDNAQSHSGGEGEEEEEESSSSDEDDGDDDDGDDESMRDIIDVELLPAKYLRVLIWA